MNIILWALQVILAIKLLTTSFSHGFQTSKPEMKQAVDKMRTSSRFWHALIAILVFVAAVGLILPGWLGIYPQLVIWTAALAALLMLVSIYFHVRFREKPKVFVSVILFVFAVFVAYGRIVLVPF
jgi:sterol desaturase/sphingolipid hydroxylase (fatty acid hydroxylase superfamily)